MSQPERKSVIVYGGCGALGARCVSTFKSHSYWVASIGFFKNPDADVNIIVNKDESFEQQEASVLAAVCGALGGTKVNGIFCVAGGWTGGNACKELAKTSEIMWQKSVCSSLLAASIAAHHLKEGGILQLTGAKAALNATAGMIGYGMVKAAVHHLTKSLAHKESGLPVDVCVVAILPTILDTQMNRKLIPQADFSTWTPLEFVAELFLRWTNEIDRPCSGNLLQLVTTNFNTELVPV